MSNPDTDWMPHPDGKPDSIDWPEPQPIDVALPPVKAFPLAALPDPLREVVEDITWRMQVPPDYVAACELVALAACVNRRAFVQPKARDTSWTEPLNLWGVLIGRPASLRTPVMSAALRPLHAIEKFWRECYQSDLDQFELDREQAELRRAAWRSAVKAEMKRGMQVIEGGAHRKGDDTSLPPPDTTLVEPACRRLIVSDTTMESLQLILSVNPAGVLLARDELAGWLAQMSRPDHGGDRQFYLSCWSGDVPYTTDRITRDQVHIPHCCLSVLGTMNPSRLQAYLHDAIQAGGAADDGFAQRLQIAVWPDMTSQWEWVDEERMSHHLAEAIFQNLSALNPDTPVRLRFSSDAQEFFAHWLGGLETDIRSDYLHPAMVSHLGKFRGLMPKLAGLFWLARWAAFQPPSPLAEINYMDLDMAQRAAQVCRPYLESHAQRMYYSVVGSNMLAAANLAEKIQQGKVPIENGILKRSAVWKKGWTGLNRPELVAAAAPILEECGWLHPLAETSGPQGGRPAIRWAVNPRIWEPKA
jgi:putative DNA primase/helicase